MNRRRKKKKESEQGAPLWMVTMSDMNTLLMTFFIILFSMMTQDELLYMNLKEFFKEMSKAANPIDPGATPEQIGLSERIEGRRPGLDDQKAALDVVRPRHTDIRITKQENRLVISLTGKSLYSVGDFRLNPEQIKVLDWVRFYMRGRRQNIIIRGFTDADPLDAWVLVGNRLRRARKGDKNPDHYLLSGLRAQEVRKYLIQGRAGVDHRQVRVGEFGSGHPVSKEKDKRAENRRIEIVISSRISSPAR